MSSGYELSDDLPVYVISVAAELSGMHPQTLRAYDELGLVSPAGGAGRGGRCSIRTSWRCARSSGYPRKRMSTSPASS